MSTLLLLLTFLFTLTLLFMELSGRNGREERETGGVYFKWTRRVYQLENKTLEVFENLKRIFNIPINPELTQDIYSCPQSLQPPEHLNKDGECSLTDLFLQDRRDCMLVPSVPWGAATSCTEGWLGITAEWAMPPLYLWLTQRAAWEEADCNPSVHYWPLTLQGSSGQEWTPLIRGGSADPCRGGRLLAGQHPLLYGQGGQDGSSRAGQSLAELLNSWLAPCLSSSWLMNELDYRKTNKKKWTQPRPLLHDHHYHQNVPPPKHCRLMHIWIKQPPLPSPLLPTPTLHVTLGLQEKRMLPKKHYGKPVDFCLCGPFKSSCHLWYSYPKRHPKAKFL